jgi:hypothetical protein
MLATRTDIAVHPAAELFPMLDDADLGMLADDIRKNGLIEPIILHQDQVLDGRNRLAACKRAGVEPQFITMDDLASPVVYVLSRNLHRRHLSVSQRAAIAADIVPMLQEEAKHRQGGSGRFGSMSIDDEPQDAETDTTPKEIPVKGRSAEIAAKHLNVSPASVQRAITVKKSDPEKFEQVKRGEITVNAAADEVREKHELSTKRNQQLADSAKHKMVTALSTANGICIGLEGLDVEKVSAACDAKEIREWAEKARELANKLRKFATRLEKAE